MAEKILGRAWLWGTGDPFEAQVWHHGLEPMTFDRRSIGDWAREHFSGCYVEDDLREMFGVPKEGAFQVLFEGEIDGGKSGYEELEWDEWFDVEKSSFEPIPAAYLDAVLAKKESI